MKQSHEQLQLKSHWLTLKMLRRLLSILAEKGKCGIDEQFQCEVAAIEADLQKIMAEK